MVKKELSPEKVLQAGPPSVVVLATCVDGEGKPNIITLGMYMPLSFKPPYVCIGIAPQRYSHDLIAETGEFVINVPSIEYEEDTHFCGIKSGRNVNKFTETRFTLKPAEKVKPPLIEECFGHLECKVVQQHTCGDHTLFVGEVLKASLNEDVITGGTLDPLKAKPITQKNHVYFTLTEDK
jgi:flavin reductase (DIM6/NTAB) family NADH-FMN oxidoreductase RutF